MKFMKILAAAAASCLLFASCGSKADADITADTAALAEELNTGITYQDPLEKLDEDMIGMLYEVDGMVTEAIVYMGSGATAEEIAVFTCNDPGAAKNDVLPVVEAHVKAQTDSFADYVPAEVAKLENAVIRQEGKYVVLSVSNDPDAANEILDKYLK